MFSGSLSGMGNLYSGYKAPFAVTSNSVGTKVAFGEIQSILGAIAIGEASIDAIEKKWN